MDLPAKVIIPSEEGTERRYLLQNVGDSKARNSTFPRKYPAVCPTELQVLAQPTLSLDNEKLMRRIIS